MSQPASGGSESAKSPERTHESWPGKAGRFLGTRGIRGGLMGLLLMAATLCVYQPCLQGQLLWDDDSWTTGLFPSLGDWRGLLTIWTHPLSLQQYYPLTGTSFWLDYHLWHFWPPPYHFENVLLHGFAAVLFWRLLLRLEVPGAFLAGAIFAFHPVNVESAAWITERKNVLSLVFYLAALLAYGRFAGFWKEDRVLPALGGSAYPRGSWSDYALAVILFVCALLAKTTALSLPAVLLLIAWWKRKKIDWRAEVTPVLPFLVLAIGMSGVTAWLEKNHLMAQGPEWSLTFGQRCLVAGRALWFYAGKIFWPADLCFVYPRWQPDVRSAVQWLYPAAALGALLALWLARKRLGRGPATAVFFFAGTLFPLLGFFNSYFMRYSFVCDHWVYISSLGLIALAAALAVRVGKYFNAPQMVRGLAAVGVVVLAILTWRQSEMYTSAETLYRTILARNPDSDMARQNLGNLLLLRGDVDGAIAQFRLGLASRPDEAVSFNNLGNALLAKGRADDAIPLLQHAVELDPADASAWLNLGDALHRIGRTDEAIADLKQGLQQQPDYSGGHEYLGRIYLEIGRVGDAIGQFETVLKLEPDSTNALNSLAWVLATSAESSIRNGPRAVELAQRADRLSGGGNAAFITTLAAAYAEAGRFPEALGAAQRALDLAVAQSNTPLIEALRGQIALYRAGSPYHLPAAK